MRWWEAPGHMGKKAYCVIQNTPLHAGISCEPAVNLTFDHSGRWHLFIPTPRNDPLARGNEQAVPVLSGDLCIGSLCPQPTAVQCQGRWLQHIMVPNICPVSKMDSFGIVLEFPHYQKNYTNGCIEQSIVQGWTTFYSSPKLMFYIQWKQLNLVCMGHHIVLWIGLHSESWKILFTWGPCTSSFDSIKSNLTF